MMESRIPRTKTTILTGAGLIGAITITTMVATVVVTMVAAGVATVVAAGVATVAVAGVATVVATVVVAGVAIQTNEHAYAINTGNPITNGGL